MNFSYFKKHTPDILPDWFLIANKNSGINSSEVKKLFKYTNDGLKGSITSGTFPAPDYVPVINITQAKRNIPPLRKTNTGIRKSQWNKKTIEDEIIRRQNLLTEYNDKRKPI